VKAEVSVHYQDSSDAHLMLADYKVSLDERYPILCQNCAPVVEAILEEREYKARTIALGTRLKQQQQQQNDVVSFKGGMCWKFQGSLWLSSNALSAVTCLIGTADVVFVPRDSN
jgi:hypothetical protein